MKYFSFKILILSVLLPPILYTLSLQTIEKHLKNKYTKEIHDIYAGDTRPLFDGSLSLKDAVHRNINRYLKNKVLVSLGLKPIVMVMTKSGTILYPPSFESPEQLIPHPTPLQVASENYRLLNEEMLISVDIKIEHYTLLSNALLGCFIFFALCVLYLYYRMSARKVSQEDLKKNLEIRRLKELEKSHIVHLKELGREREKLSKEYKRIKQEYESEKSKYSKNENEMLEEIVSLEARIDKSLFLQNKQKEMIAGLEGKIKQFEKSRQKSKKQKTKTLHATKKRFKALYKKLAFHERAVNGFSELTEDMKIKCEELIHQLNADTKNVAVKRKVFGKKNRTSVLELMYGYNGRLYYRLAKGKKSRLEILAIGTKNTQFKDLEFLDKL